MQEQLLRKPEVGGGGGKGSSGPGDDGVQPLEARPRLPLLDSSS